jgi:hypothetical protein
VFVLLISLPHLRVLDCTAATNNQVRCIRWQQLDVSPPPFVISRHETTSERGAHAAVDRVIDEGQTHFRVKVETTGAPFYWGRTHGDIAPVDDNVRALNAFFTLPVGHLHLEERGFYWGGLPIALGLLVFAAALLRDAARNCRRNRN